MWNPFVVIYDFHFLSFHLRSVHSGWNIYIFFVPDLNLMTIRTLNDLHCASKHFVRASPTPMPTRFLAPLLLPPFNRTSIPAHHFMPMSAKDTHLVTTVVLPFVPDLNLMTIRTLNYLHRAIKPFVRASPTSMPTRFLAPYFCLRSIVPQSMHTTLVMPMSAKDTHLVTTVVLPFVPDLNLMTIRTLNYLHCASKPFVRASPTPNVAHAHSVPRPLLLPPFNRTSIPAHHSSHAYEC